MKIEALQEALDSGMNTNVHKFYLPVEGKFYNFRPLKVAQLKTITKILVSSEDKPFDTYETLCAIVKSMCIDDLDMTSLSEYDRTKIMYEILTANDMISSYKIKCPECGHENDIKPNTSEVLEKMNQYKNEEIHFDNESLDRLTCKISVPGIKRLYNFYYLLQNKLVSNEDLFKCYVDDIEINFSNEDVETIKLSQGEDEKSLEEFIKNYEMLPAILLKNKRGESVDSCVEKIVNNMYVSQSVTKKCEKCGAELGGVASASNFI